MSISSTREAKFKMLREILDRENVPEDLNNFGMEHLSTEEFQQVFDFIEILINVRERVRNERRQERLKMST